MKNVQVKDLAIEEPVTKINPFTLSRPQSKTVSQTFTDSLHPGVELRLTLKGLDQAELLQAYEVAERYIARYLGSPPDVQPEMIFPLVDNQPVALSRQLIQGAVVLAVMQSDNSYTVEDFIALSITMPNAWVEMSKEVNKLHAGGSKNA